MRSHPSVHPLLEEWTNKIRSVTDKLNKMDLPVKVTSGGDHHEWTIEIHPK